MSFVYVRTVERRGFTCRMRSDETSNNMKTVSAGGNVVFVANDWHTALVPCYLKSEYKPAGQFLNAKVSGVTDA